MNKKAQETARWFLDYFDKNPEFVPVMHSFTSLEAFEVLKPEKHVCGTSYCLAGIHAHKHNYPEKYISGLSNFEYVPYAKSLVGWSSDIYEFLFGGGWPDSREHAIKRCKYVAECGRVPDSWGESELDFDWGLNE